MAGEIRLIGRMVDMDFSSLKRTGIFVNAAEHAKDAELWRQGIGLGGASHEPLPPKVVNGLRLLRPRLIRIFLQEYFNIYPDHGVFDWSRLDPYMESLAQTGAKVLATVNIKPPVLFPNLGQEHWQPNDVGEYQDVIRALVKRYSLDRRIVTHWEHLNEPNLGEDGGCPFLIPGAQENYDFYRMLAKTVLEVFPEAKVGGPAVSHYDCPMLEEFIRLCHENGTPLQFVSWHSYKDDPASLRAQTEHVRHMIRNMGASQPELMINEMNKGFDYQDAGHPSYHLVSVEEQAYQGKRAAFLASAVMEMTGAGLDWSHYFSAWDCRMRPLEFSRFYSPHGITEVMYRHWNESPHRYGLFSDSGRVRPQYFVYRLLAQMDGSMLHCKADSGIAAIAAGSGRRTAVLMSNYALDACPDRIALLQFEGLTPGLKKLNVYRIDDMCRWDEETLTLLPVETRRVDVLERFACQCLLPANSVASVILEDAEESMSC